MDTDQLISLGGALLILGSYAAAQLKWLRTGDRLHSALNTVGGAVVAIIAARQHQPSVVVLEGAWSLISLAALIRAVRALRATPR